MRPGTSLLTRFLHDFWRNIFLLLYFMNWPSFIARLALLYEILGNMCIVIVCEPVCDINFEINFVFLIKPFFCMNKKSRKRFKYLESQKIFEIKTLFYHVSVSLIQIISRRQKNADAKVVQSISRRQKWNSIGNFQKIVFFQIFN